LLFKTVRLGPWNWISDRSGKNSLNEEATASASFSSRLKTYLAKS
jgi:hypothetical protein